MVADENGKSYVHVQPVTSTHVIVTFQRGFGVFSGDIWRVKVAAAEDKAQLVWRRRPESNRGPRICNHRNNPYFQNTYTSLFSELGILSRCFVVFEKPIFGVILQVYPVS